MSAGARTTLEICAFAPSVTVANELHSGAVSFALVCRISLWLKEMFLHPSGVWDWSGTWRVLLCW